MPPTAAAATADQQKHLKKGKPATVVGEVIDVSCYAQLGKRGEKHHRLRDEVPPEQEPRRHILDDKGNVYTLFVEQHDPRRDGAADLKGNLHPPDCQARSGLRHARRGESREGAVCRSDGADACGSRERAGTGRAREVVLAAHRREPDGYCFGGGGLI